MNSLMGRLREWARSSKGRERIQATVQEKRKSGSGRTGGGGYVTTIEDMQKCSEELIRRLRSTAEILPPSVYAHFASLNYSQPEQLNDDFYQTEVWFEDDLSRMSLKVTRKKDGISYRTGEGIENIVALFETGYGPTKRVGGVWEGREDLGPIGSKTHREGIRFMQATVDEFNNDPNWGRKYNVKAYLSEVYDEAFLSGESE